MPYFRKPAYCEYKTNQKKRIWCGPTDIEAKNSDNCEINQNNKCVVKKNAVVKKDAKVQVKNVKQVIPRKVVIPSYLQKDLDDWNEFSSIFDKSKQNGQSIKYTRTEDKNKNVLNKSSYRRRCSIPAQAISIVTMEKYISNLSDYKNKSFYQLYTCDSKCSNKGCFVKDEIDMLLESNNLKCPFCNNKFDLETQQTQPPFGTMIIGEVNSLKNHDWIEIDFHLEPSKKEKYSVSSTSRVAFYPNTEKGKLATWLVKKAWTQGRLFKMGISITHNKYGIVYSGVHLRTSITGGVAHHGYSNNPNKDMEMILMNLISECNAVDIFTPEQIMSFSEQQSVIVPRVDAPKNEKNNMKKEKEAAKLIGKIMMTSQMELTRLRNKHIDKLRKLEMKEHRLVYAYPHAFLMLIIFKPEITFTRMARQLQKHGKTILPLHEETYAYNPDLANKIKKFGVSYTKQLFPEYITNLTRVISSFPRPSRPFYVYRTVKLRSTPRNGDWIAQPMPFSSSLNQWLTISFASLDKYEPCCMYRIKVTPEMHCIILGDTPFMSAKYIKHKDYNKFEYGLWNTKDNTPHLSKYNQFEVLLPPGILKVKKVSKNMYKPSTDAQKRKILNQYKNYKGKNYASDYPKNGVTMVDVDFEPLSVSPITEEDLLVQRKNI